MSDIEKKTLWLTGTAILIIAAIYFWSYASSSIRSALCGNQVIETKDSPDGTKKAVIFVRDCGATTDWSTEASVLNANEIIVNGDTGNVMSINSDHGKAWPLALKGWPIITSQWENPNSLVLHYSKDSIISYKKTDAGNVELQFAIIAPEFVQQTKLEIR